MDLEGEVLRSSSRRPVYQQHRAGQQMTLDVPEDYSLRAYMEVLYLRPTVTFSLRGELIAPRCPLERLALEYYKFEDYTPMGLPDERKAPIVVHCGYQEEKSKHCGFHIYNKNRLIRMYQRFGAQLQANAMMKVRGFPLHHTPRTDLIAHTRLILSFLQSGHARCGGSGLLGAHAQQTSLQHHGYRVPEVPEALGEIHERLLLWGAEPAPRGDRRGRQAANARAERRNQQERQGREMQRQRLERQGQGKERRRVW